MDLYQVHGTRDSSLIPKQVLPSINTQHALLTDLEYIHHPRANTIVSPFLTSSPNFLSISNKVPLSI